MVTLPSVITEAFWVARMHLQRERGYSGMAAMLKRLIFVQLTSNH